MTEDPTFQERADLDKNYSNVHLATYHLACDTDNYMILPDGRGILVPGGKWPKFSSKMPWAERIIAYPENGDPKVVTDNGKKIDALLESTPDGGTGSGGAGPTGAQAGGCGCRTAGPSGNAWLGVAGLVGFIGLVGARRRHRG